MRKSASDFSTVGENKNKTNKLHLATCYLNRSQLQFCFFFFRFLFCQVLELQMDTSIYLYRSGSHWAGEKEPGRQTFIRKANPGANTSWLYRESSYGPLSPLSWSPTCSLWRWCCTLWRWCCTEHKRNPWRGGPKTRKWQRRHKLNSHREEWCCGGLPDPRTCSLV